MDHEGTGHVFPVPLIEVHSYGGAITRGVVESFSRAKDERCVLWNDLREMFPSPLFFVLGTPLFIIVLAWKSIRARVCFMFHAVLLR